MNLSLHFAARSHVGLLRDGNEDSGYAGPGLLLVADGMGGQVAGELASSVVVRTVSGLDRVVAAGGRPVAPLPGGDALTVLDDAVNEANDRLRSIVADNPHLEGMGTTLTALLWTGDAFGLAHIGDSRAYRLRGGALEQITVDHTWVQRLIDEGRITEEEAGTHPQRSLIMRALDGRSQAETDLRIVDVQPGDRFLICSDGLSGVVSAETIEMTLAGYADPHQVADTLIQLALRGGGPDNITCIVGDVVDEDAAATTVPGSDAQVTVGAAAEGRDGLPRFGAAGDDLEQTLHDGHDDTPAGRAARLRPGRSRHGQEPAGAEVESDEEGPSRKRWVKPVAWLGAVVVVLGAAAGVGYWWSQRQYYVALASDSDHVAIYRGLHESLVGFHLSSVYQQQDVTLSQLPSYSRTALQNTISAKNLSDARSIVDNLDKQALACFQWRHPATPAPTKPPAQPKPAGGPVPGGKPSPTPTHTVAPPVTTPVPSPSPTGPDQQQLDTECTGTSDGSGH